MSCWCWGKKEQHALDVVLACFCFAGYVVGKEKGALGVRSKRLTGRGVASGEEKAGGGPSASYVRYQLGMRR